MGFAQIRANLGLSAFSTRDAGVTFNHICHRPGLGNVCECVASQRESTLVVCQQSAEVMRILMGGGEWGILSLLPGGFQSLLPEVLTS